MKITTMEGMGRIYAERAASNSGKTEKESFSGVLGNTVSDSVTISGSEGKSDEEFVKALGSEISASVKAGNSSASLSAIKQQIALGEYDINVNDIVKRILL